MNASVAKTNHFVSSLIFIDPLINFRSEENYFVTNILLNLDRLLVKRSGTLTYDIADAESENARRLFFQMMKFKAAVYF